MITCRVQFEMAFTQYFGTPEPWKILSTETRIDTADFPGLVASWFEIVLQDYVGANAHIYIVDELDNICADLAPAEGSWGRQKVALTLTDGDHSYFVKIVEDSEDYGNVYFGSAKLLLDVVDSDILRVPIPLIASDMSTPGGGGTPMDGYPLYYNDIAAWCAPAVLDASYTYVRTGSTSPVPFSQCQVIFKKEEDKFQTIDHWDFDVIAHLFDQASGSIALFNKTTGLMVDGSEISWSLADDPWTEDMLDYFGLTQGTYPIRKRVRIENNATNFTNGDDFEFRVKAPGSASWNQCFYIHKVVPSVVLTNASHALLYNRINEGQGSYYGGGATGTYDGMCRFLYEASKYPAGSQIYWENTGWEVNGGGKAWLVDVDTEDDAWPTAEGHGTELANIQGTQPPVDIGDWYGPGVGGIPTAEAWEAVEGGPVIASSNSVQMNTPGMTRSMQTRALSFDQSLVGKTITDVKIYVALALAGQAAYLSANGHSRYIPRSEAIPPDSWVVNGWYFDITGDQAWTPASVLAAILTIMAIQPSNTTLTSFYINEVALIVGWGRDFAEANLPVDVRTRVRSEDISAEFVDGHRYITHWYGTTTDKIDDHSMGFLLIEVTGTVPGGAGECVEVTGTISTGNLIVVGSGEGSNSTAWRVVRASDGLIMTSGAGETASFSFRGAYGVVYQLQFLGEDGNWTSEGCTFMFSAPVAPGDVVTRGIVRCAP